MATQYPFKTIPYASEAEWRAIRRTHIGSSEAAALFHEQKEYAPSLYQLWQMKAGRIPEPVVEGKRLEWGKKLEAVIASWAEEEFNLSIEPGPYCEHPTIPGLGCSLDFLITDGPEVQRYGTMGILECKNVDWLIHRREWTDNEPPIHILLQHQEQLACTGLAWGMVACLVGGNEPKKYHYEARPGTIAEIEKRATEFWRSIEEDRPPPVDNRKSTSDALKALYCEPTEVPYDCSGDLEFPEHVAALRQARLDKKEMEIRERFEANWILSRIGNSSLVVEGDLPVLTAKTINRAAYTVKASSYRMIKLSEMT